MREIGREREIRRERERERDRELGIRRKHVLNVLPTTSEHRVISALVFVV